jgi:hypothetical protein
MDRKLILSGLFDGGFTAGGSAAPDAANLIAPGTTGAVLHIFPSRPSAVLNSLALSGGSLTAFTYTGTDEVISTTATTLACRSGGASRLFAPGGKYDSFSHADYQHRRSQLEGLLTDVCPAKFLPLVAPPSAHLPSGEPGRRIDDKDAQCIEGEECNGCCQARDQNP